MRQAGRKTSANSSTSMQLIQPSCYCVLSTHTVVDTLRVLSGLRLPFGDFFVEP